MNGQTEQKSPPNLHSVQCCGTCWHSDWSHFAEWTCEKYGGILVEPSNICDDFTETTEDLINEKFFSHARQSP